MSENDSSDISGIVFTSLACPTEEDQKLWDSLTSAQRLAVIEREMQNATENGRSPLPENSSALTIKLEDLPDPDDRDAIWRFAASFNGYLHFGSFKASAGEAQAKRRATLVDLRNELFFNQRAGNHQGSHDLRNIYCELLPHFKRLLES